ncbi:hypothetical protein [Scytonema sp. UIC 10036]|nr:hypothetical protein [Scytonema sp. UIC 10036]
MAKTEDFHITPDALTMDALLQTVDTLHSLGSDSRLLLPEAIRRALKP